MIIHTYSVLFLILMFILRSASFKHAQLSYSLSSQWLRLSTSVASTSHSQFSSSSTTTSQSKSSSESSSLIVSSFNPQGKFNWARVHQFWRNILDSSSPQLHSHMDTTNNATAFSDSSTTTNNMWLPKFATGDGKYGVTNLQEIHQCGYTSGEFHSKDSRYTKISTYALRIGYDGQNFFGYQTQKNASMQSVEDVINRVIQKTNTIAAGRTDRDVSALSQVITFSSPIEKFNDVVMEKFRKEKACMDGDVAAYECVRVPRKFNARSSATWRRYLYVIPLECESRAASTSTLSSQSDVSNNAVNSQKNNINSNNNNNRFVDLSGIKFTTISNDTLKYNNSHSNHIVPKETKLEIDLQFIAQAFKKLENKTLPYNAFAYHTDRSGGEGLKDYCTMFRANCFLFDMPDDDGSSSRNNAFNDSSNKNDGVVVDLAAYYNIKTDSNDNSNSNDDDNSRGDDDFIINNNNNNVNHNTKPMLEYDATSTNATSSHSSSTASNSIKSVSFKQPAICIELVGSRFLRQMVRRLVATAVREALVINNNNSSDNSVNSDSNKSRADNGSTNSNNNKNTNVLVDICHASDRRLVCPPFPGEGLCMAGVGYDKVDLSFYKFMPKEKRLQVMKKYGLKNDVEEEEEVE